MPSLERLWFVYAPDYTDAGALKRRLDSREQHLAGLKKLIDEGWIKVAGPLVTPESLEPWADKQFLGSTFIISRFSIEEVRERMQSDIYWSKNVWDKEKMVITGFIPATPL